MIDFLKKNKYMVAGISGVAVFIAIIGLASVVNAKEAEVSERIEAIVSDVNSLYEDETKAVLAEGVTMDQVLSIEEEIAVLLEDEFLTDESKSELELASTELGYVKQMIELRDLATALFNEDGTIKEGADIEAVQIKADSLKEFKPEYVATIQVQIDDANAQVAAIAKAEEEAKKQAEQYASADDSTSSSSSSSSNDSDSSSSSSSSSNNGSSSNGGSNGSSGSGSGSNDNDSSDGDDSWSGEVELTVDHYEVHSAMAQDGSDITDEVNDLEFETEEEMNDYMYSNYPGCAFSYTIVYDEVW